jgi:hypothetical protein
LRSVRYAEAVQDEQTEIEAELPAWSSYSRQESAADADAWWFPDLSQCYAPLHGFRGRGGVFTQQRRDATSYRPVTVPCGQCIGCRLERAREMAARAMHEASGHDANCMITLTYNDDFLPIGGTLVPHHLQDFFKRLRARLRARKVRYLACGEYGGQFGRPHYHSCIFGFDFPDREYLRDSDGGPLYSSAFLQEVWPYGFVGVSELTFESAGYVARYCVDKVTGAKAHDHYWSLDPRTGELHQILPEFSRMSLRPGIGADWAKRYFDDLYPSDTLPIPGRGVFGKPPRYYDKLLERENAELYREVKGSRLLEASKFEDEQSEERLRAKEKVKRAQLKVGRVRRTQL